MKENLKPCRTTEEARERGRKGGINSGKRKKEKRKLKEIAEMLLDMKAPDDIIAGFELLYPDLDAKEMTNRLAIVQRLILNALAGDNKAFELLRDQIGEKPKEEIVNTNQNINITDEKVINAVLKKVKDL
ncbi:MAG: hypothetical protein IJX99_05500 [Clostridia bacterium]|nr:hypothetical protein [Clostridia bacterium]